MTMLLGRVVAAAASLALLAGCSVAAPAEPTLAPSTASTPTPSASPVETTPTPSSSPSAEPEEVEAYNAAPGLTISSVSNFRDVAGEGEGLLLADGSRMAVGVVFRSGKLAPLTSADRKKLVDAGLSDIYDLRTPAVISRTPDPAVKGAERHEANIFAVRASDPVRPGSVAEARTHMRTINRNFVASPAQREAIASVLESIADDDGPVLVHCTEGKDRTGWISAMLQLIAGADEETVIEQYLLSNTYRDALIDREVAKVKRSSGTKAAQVKRALLQVDASYLKAGLTEIEDRFDGLDGYLTEGLGLSEKTVETLRDRLRAR